MHTLTKTQVWIRFSTDIELIGTIEHAGVTIGGTLPDLYLLAGLDQLSAEVDVARGGAPLGRGGRRPPDDLLDCRRQQIEIFTQRTHLLGALGQCQQATSDGIARRLGARAEK